MITFEKNEAGREWHLKAYGVSPYIARIRGFSEEYRYQREWWGRTRNDDGCRLCEVTLLYNTRVDERVESFVPALLDIRHDGYARERIPFGGSRQWFILHGLDNDTLQLTEVNQAAIDVLISQPLFSQLGISVGNLGRIFEDVDRSATPRSTRHQDPAIIQSPWIPPAVNQAMIGESRPIGVIPPGGVLTARAETDMLEMLERNNQALPYQSRPTQITRSMNEEIEYIRNRRGRVKAKKKAALPPVLPIPTGRKFNWDD